MKLAPILVVTAALICVSEAEADPRRRKTEPKRNEAAKRNENVQPKFVYPEIRRNESVKDDYFGTIVSDPYRFLEDPDSAETVKFVEAENNLTLPYVEQAEGRETIRKTLESLQRYTKYYNPRVRKNRYFFYKKEGLQNQHVLYYQDGLRGTPKVLIDPNTLSEDGTTTINTGTASHSGEIYAYGLSSKGSDWVTISFRNVSTDEDYPEVLKHTKWPEMEWSPDDVGVYYARYPEPEGDAPADGSETTANYNSKIYFHRVGTPQSEDVLVVEFPEHPKWSLSAELSDDDEYLIINAREGILYSQIHYVKLAEFVKSGYKIKPEVQPVVDKLENRYEYIGSNGNVIYLRTDKDAPNYRIVGVYLDNPDEKYWSVLLPENKRDVLDWAYPINTDQMLVVYARDVKSILQLRRLTDGSLIKEFKLDVGSIDSVSAERDDKEAFFKLESYLSPGIIYHLDFTKPEVEPEVYWETGPEGYDSSLYTSKQVFYPSKDGTNISLFIIHRKDLKLDGTAPTILYGYGGFGISLDPGFSSNRMAFIQLFNGVYAVANLRGGGEYGSKWHDAGRQLNKQNVFDDFQAAAEYLIANKYTTQAKLAINGGSNGGLLVGACTNQRPDLFGAAVAQVGVMDMLRYHKFTIGYAWSGDYGTSDDKVNFENLYKYSPLHNIRVPRNQSVQYPAVLVTTADHDDRVVPLHSYKYIAELQHTVGSSPRQTNPLMILIETNAGHGSGKPTSKKIAEVTDVYSFLVRALNLKVVEQ